jgi:HTH-type transcriptional regulator/antitoxin HigA
MNINQIKTKADYHAALMEIEGLMAAGPRTPEGDRLDVLVTLVEAWERKHEPMDLPGAAGRRVLTHPGAPEAV